MKKHLRKLLLIAFSIMIVMGMSATAFAYTSLEDDGDRAKAQEGTLGVVTTNSGMLRTLDAGTSVQVGTDGMVNVTVTSTSSKSWGKITKIALIETAATDAEKEEAAKLVTFEDSTYVEDEAAQRVFHYSIPVSEIGMKVPVCVYLEDSKEWKTYNTQSYYVVLFTKDIYNQLVAAEAAATDDTAKANLGAAIEKASASLETKQLELEKLNGVMMTVNSATLYKVDGQYLVDLVINGTSYSKAFMGYASDANTDDTGAIDIVNDTDAKESYVTLPVEALGEPMVVAFKGSKYFNRTLTVTADKFTYDNTTVSLDRFDSMTEEEAIARAAMDTSISTVNQLIEAIQVQVRDENTDKYCAIAKAYYDALSDRDKQKLDDPGYFGDDTGDASLDDPLNTAPTKEKELLVVSFGTSFNDNRVATIGAIEKALVAAYPDYDVRRAFTAQIIINHVQARDAEFIDNVDQAMDKAVAAGVKELVVQPTHLMSGAEYDELKGAIDKYADKMTIKYAKPLLDSDADKQTVAKEVVAAAAQDAGFASTEEAVASKETAFVFMGHGTAHAANVTYTYMQQTMEKLGYANCFIGTVEGEPAETEVNAVLKRVQDAGFKKVVLRPLMVVAGDHANNDMAGDEEDSWKSIFGAALGAENVVCQINGLGEIPAVQQMYVSHAKVEIMQDQNLQVTANNKKFKAKDLKKGKKTFKAVNVKGAKGTVSYVAKANNKKSNKVLTFKNGKITVKKGTKKGTYKMTVTVNAAATKDYNAAKAAPVTVTVKVQ